jgi:hypothetical protein
MGSIKDKLTKTLRKITPKEIAPILPIASMFIPGMQGLSPLLKFALPQLLTAAGSARTSGKISGLNQALAGIGSLAGINASNAAAANAAQSAGTATAVPGATYSSAPVSSAAGQSALASGSALPTAATTTQILDPAAYATAVGPSVGPSFGSNFLNQAAQTTSNFVPGMTTLGEGMTNLSSLLPGGVPAQFGYNMLAPAALGAGMMATDQVNLEALEAEAEAALQAGNIEAYQEAMQAVADATARFSDPTNQYGNNPFGDFNPFTGGILNAAKGGRVGAMSGLFTGDMINEEYLPEMSLEEQALQDLKDRYSGILGMFRKMYDKRTNSEFVDPFGMNTGGRVGAAMGAMGGSQMYPMNPAPGSVAPNMPQGMQVDGRNGTFIPMGAQEKKDDVPAMLAKNEFVMTSDAVKGMGNGDVNAGAQKMYDLMNQLEANV